LKAIAIRPQRVKDARPTNVAAKGDTNMDLTKISQLLGIEEKVRNHPNLKPIYDAVLVELHKHAKDVSKEAEHLAKEDAKAAAVDAAAEAKDNEVKLGAKPFKTPIFPSLTPSAAKPGEE
jgi:hypothetical protein